MSTTLRPQGSTENVGRGAGFALLAIPVGIILLVLVASIGFVSALVGLAIALSAVWLYRKGSGGVVSRTGAIVVTVIVLVSLLVGYFASLVVIYSHGLGHLNYIGIPGFWTAFFTDFPANFQTNLLNFGLTLLFGVGGAIRILIRAFSVAPARNSPADRFGSGPDASAPTTAVEASTYLDDVGGAATASADEKTPPPTA
jgi:hypothetical protein